MFGGAFVTESVNEFASQRENMVENQIIARGVRDDKVIQAMRKVERHLFVPENLKSYAYDDEPLPIGDGQTISQPYIVAYMTEALELKGEERVLEIGTGSGYQTAVLAEIAKDVHTVEIVDALSRKAQDLLHKLGYQNIRFKVGDGTFGWKDYAPYDAVIVTAAPPAVPRTLQDQLVNHGRMVIPVGAGFQELVLVTRENKNFRKKKLLPVRFVPLISTH
jgi:protein-L-isoaspartate(D-aspartate) O-methyltransferase